MSQRFFDFVRSPRGRALKVAVGLGLVVGGGLLESLLGLMGMMFGLILVVTGLAGICLIEEVVCSWPISRSDSGDRRHREVEPGQ